MDLELHNSDKIELIVNTRPFLNDFLKTVSQVYEIIVFTRRSSKYSESVLDVIDPMREYIRAVYSQ